MIWSSLWSFISSWVGEFTKVAPPSAKLVASQGRYCSITENTKTTPECRFKLAAYWAHITISLVRKYGLLMGNDLEEFDAFCKESLTGREVWKFLAFRCLNPGHFYHFLLSTSTFRFLQVENCQFISVNTHLFPTNGDSKGPWSWSGACREGLTASSSLWWGMDQNCWPPKNRTGIIKWDPFGQDQTSSKCTY